VSKHLGIPRVELSSMELVNYKPFKDDSTCFLFLLKLIFKYVGYIFISKIVLNSTDIWL
jgi:hypothetical protein